MKTTAAKTPKAMREPQIGDKVVIKDKKSIYEGKSGVISREMRKDWVVDLVVDGEKKTGVVSRSKVELVLGKIEEEAKKAKSETVIPNNASEFKEKMKELTARMNTTERQWAQDDGAAYKKAKKEREEYYSATKKKWYDALQKAEKEGDIPKYKVLAKMISEAGIYEKGGNIQKEPKMAKGGPVEDKKLLPVEIALKEAGIKYEKKGPAHAPISKVYRKANQNDKYYKTFADIVYRYNLESKVVVVLAQGGPVEEEVYYVEFLNKDKKFARDKKTFTTHELAKKWGRENIENFHEDMVRFERIKMAQGGEISSDFSILNRDVAMVYQMLDRGFTDEDLEDWDAATIKTAKELNADQRFQEGETFDWRQEGEAREYQDKMQSQGYKVFEFSGGDDIRFILFKDTKKMAQGGSVKPDLLPKGTRVKLKLDGREGEVKSYRKNIENYVVEFSDGAEEGYPRKDFEVLRKSESAKPDKVKLVMREFKKGKLHSGSKTGPVVKNEKQAMAIAISEQKKAEKQGSPFTKARKLAATKK